MKKKLKNKIAITTAMVGAVIVTPTVVDVLEDQSGLDVKGKVGFNQLENKAFAFEGGKGTVEDPYLISTRTQLESINNDLSAHYKLTSNINLGNVSWTPIGGTTGDGFKGSLDGAGFEISNLKGDLTTVDMGIFRRISNGTVKNLTLTDFNIVVTSKNAGTIAGSATGSKFENITVNNFKFASTSSSSTGGLVGSSRSNSFNTVKANIDFSAVTKAADLGGIVGSTAGDLIQNAYTEGIIKGALTTGGGIAGENSSSGTTKIYDAISNVDIEVAEATYIGGIVGRGIMSEVYRAIAYGKVVNNDSSTSRTSYIGGVVGSLGLVGESNSYFGKLRYVYAFNREISAGIIAKSKRIERIGNILAGSATDLYGNAYEIIPGNAGSNMVGDVITKDQVFTKQQYEQFGYDFENVWTIDEGKSAPKLKIATQQDTTMEMAADVKEKYSFAGGSGTAADPYLIADVDDFKLVSTNLKSHFKLVADIDFDWIPINPIGETMTTGFSGTLDGNGFKLKNVQVNSAEDYVGIFGALNGANIRNVHIENVSVTSSGKYVGSLAGYARNTTLTNVAVTGEVNVSGGNYTGGMVGNYDYTQSMPRNFNLSKLLVDQTTGKISGKDYTGGVFGSIEHGYGDMGTTYRVIVDEVSVNAKVVGSSEVGGFGGKIRSGTTLRNAVIRGEVTGTKYVGGIGRSDSSIWGPKRAAIFENIIVYSTVKGASSTSTNIGGGFGEFSEGTMDGIFLYNNHVSTGKTGTITRSIGYDSLGDMTKRKTITNLYQFHTILGGAPIGFTTGIVTNELVASEAFYKSKSTMAFGSKWVFAENGHPTLAFAPVAAEHTFTEDEQGASQFAGGAGTVDNPFLISTPAHLKMVAGNEASHFKLANDIDMDHEVWSNIIGATTKMAFTGSFDGNGYAIKNIDIQSTGSYQGIFGYVGPTGKISNLKIDGATVTTSATYGSLLVGKMEGQFSNITIQNVNATVGKDYFGLAAGLYAGAEDVKTGAGIVNGLVIKDVRITAPTTIDYIGGAFGNISTKANMQNIFVDADISAGERVGIFAGQIASTGAYKDIVTMGSVDGLSYLGGYAGNISSSSDHSNVMIFADSIGSAQTVDLVGGFAGNLTSASSVIQNIYSNVRSVQGKTVATVGKFAGKMSTSSSFTPLYINVISDMSGGHSTKVNNSYTEDQLKTTSTYSRNGLVFDTASNWKKDDAGFPVLKHHEVNLQLAGDKWTSGEVNRDAEYISNVTSYLDTAVTNKDSSLLNLATVEINKISDTNSQKQTLINRLAEVKVFLDADTALKVAEATFREGHFAEAKKAVALVANATWKAELQTRIDALAEVLESQKSLEAVAEQLILAAEANPSEETIALAQAALDQLNYSITVEVLSSRLADVSMRYSTEVSLRTNLEALEFKIATKQARLLYYKLAIQFDESANIIDVTPYAARLNQAFIDLQIAEMYGDLFPNADALVVKAEANPIEGNITAAQEAVTALPAGGAKNSLQERIDAIYEKLGVTAALDSAIKKAQNSMARADYEAANVLFGKLTVSADITKYTSQMANLLKLIESAELVVIAETEKTAETVSKARTKLNSLDKSYPNWTVLDERLKAIELELASKGQLEKAEKAVEKAEGSLLLVDVEAAQLLVDALPNEPILVTEKKKELNERLEAIRSVLAAQEAFEKAEEAVVKVEGTLKREDAESAQLLINKLPTGAERDVLQERLDVIFKTIEDEESKLASIDEATKALEKAESTKTDEDINSAQEKVTALPDSDIKTSLQDRLDALKADADALTKATEAVVKAEGSKETVDIDDAQTKVTALKDSAGKDALQDRLDKLKAQIEADNALAEATAAVKKAEGSKTDEDINDAQGKVTVLPESEVKQALQDRLDKLTGDQANANALVEATKAVEKAEGSKALADIGDAQGKVTALPDSEAKQALQNRLDALKEELENSGELEKATAAVKKAETTYSQDDVNVAQELVTKLDASPEKDALKERLDVVQAEINVLAEATKAVEKAEGSKSTVDINDAQMKVIALKDSPAKQALQDRLDVLKATIDVEKALGEAVKAVEKAESTKTDEDINAAQEKVTVLPDDEAKQALQDRLNAIKADLDTEKALDEATKAVDQAETTKADTDINKAQEKVTALPEGEAKQVLQDRIEKIKAEKESDVLFQTLVNEVKVINKGILDDVIKPAKFSATREELEAIRQRGEVLTNADQKAQVNTLIDATLALMNLVDTIEGGDKSKETIDKLPASKIKDKYLAEIAEGDALAAAEQAVKKAEETIELPDIEKAENNVAKLAPSDKKEELKERLKAVRDKYEEQQLIKRATTLVEQAESSKRITDIERAEDVVKQLKDGDVKTDLQNRLNALRKGLDDAELNAATQAVEKAEELKTNNSIGYAKDKVNALRPSPEKTALLDRIAALEKAIYDQAQMDRLYNQALEAVIKAENSSLVTYLNSAIKLVGKVSDADDRKQGLVDRLNAIILRNQIASVDSELGRLELRPSQSGVEKVQGLIDNLPDTVAEKEAFQARLDAIKRSLDNENYAKALKGVEFAESAKIESKRAAYYSALPLVDVLLNGERKTDLEMRLAKVLAEVEAYEKLDGDYKPGDSVVKSAQSIKDDKVKPLLLAWAKAVEDAEVYNSNTLIKALTKAKQDVTQEILNNPKYKDLIEELTQRSSHIQESSIVFSGLVARGVIKNAYVAVLKFENDRTEINKKAAEVLINDLKRFKGHEGQVEKLFVRINRIEIVAE
ncbi:hypothetical protein ABD91_25905 [Lysinibacillus sphaericus]|uniref:hypothetical protein n=1 Tax=Lysinibacillus sphaericus TaxID=1421 RepID=UPI0018CCADC1|nr:hypothetical protein [Lysinibacillus sphaericus]MBG9694171.1 hypothetical protein [Lysinibacillus sphaericus]